MAYQEIYSYDSTIMKGHELSWQFQLDKWCEIFMKKADLFASKEMQDSFQSQEHQQQQLVL